jgi:hypothetical protein
MHTIKVGDRFKLGPWTWRVSQGGEFSQLLFRAIRTEGKGAEFEYHWFPIEQADALDWLPEPATISKAAEEGIMERFNKAVELCSNHLYRDELKKILDSMVRNDE